MRPAPIPRKQNRCHPAHLPANPPIPTLTQSVRRGTAQDLPPLLALRAFEAVARHLSFIKAAAELSVTQSALSHQVQKLEEHLGKPLFIRRTRAIDLTEDGQHYYD